MLLDTSAWSNADKAHFLAVLAHELTVSARGTYAVGTDGVLEPEVLRGFNEIEHRVTSSCAIICADSPACHWRSYW
jgi:hypothetical protein